MCKTRAPAREPPKKQDSKSFALACAFLRPPIWPSVSCVSCFPFSCAVLCPCLPFCAGCCGFHCACLSSPLFHGRRPKNRALRQVPLPSADFLNATSAYWGSIGYGSPFSFISFPFRYVSLEPLGLERTSDRITSDLYVQRASRRWIRSSQSPEHRSVSTGDQIKSHP